MTVDAWAQLGTVLTNSYTAEEAMKEGGLAGWNVRKLPIYAGRSEIDALTRVPARMATVRRRHPSILGIVGPNYQIVQNEDHAAMLNEILIESGATPAVAGELHGGSRVFITMRLPGHLRPGIEGHIAAINSHDGSLSFTLMVTPVNVETGTLLNFGENVLRVRHSSGAATGLHRQARAALDFTFDYLEDLAQRFDQLADVPMSPARFESILDRHFGAGLDASSATRTRAKTRLDDIAEAFSDAEEKTAWTGLNALAAWSDHSAPTRGAEELRDSGRAYKAIFSPTFKNKALRVMEGEAR